VLDYVSLLPVQAPESRREPARLRTWWWVAFIPVAVAVGAAGGWFVRTHPISLPHSLAAAPATSTPAPAPRPAEKHIAALPVPAPPRPAAKEPPAPVALPPVSKPLAAREPMAPAKPAATPAPQPAAPAAPPAPALTAETAKWIASMDAQWRASYQRDVEGPFEAGLVELRRQHYVALGNPLAAAKKAGNDAEVAIYTTERNNVTKGNNPPASDDEATPPALKLARANFRSQFSRLDRERYDRARALFAKCEDLLTKAQAKLGQRQLTADVASVQRERDTLRQEWLQPPAVVSTALPPAMRATPAPTKMTSQQIVTKLMDLNALVYAKHGKGDSAEIKSATEVGDNEKLTFTRVDFRPKKLDETPLTTADYAILDSLSEVPELTLSGTALKDSVMEKLRPFHALKSLTLNGAKPSPAGYAVLPSLPELRDLNLNDTDTKDEAMKTVFQCRKLQHLHLANLTLTDAAFADIGKLSALEEIRLTALDKIGSPAFAHFPECRALKRVYLGGFIVLSGMIENLGKCKDLEAINLPAAGLKDADVAPLGTLMKLKSLDLSNSAVTGDFIDSWQQHQQLTSLSLSNAGGVNDNTCKEIEHTFPKLEQLTVKIAASGFSSEGVAALARLRALRGVRFEGDGFNDDCLAELAHCETLTSLSIVKAQLTEAGVAALARFPHLADLSVNYPPITDAAMKAFARCKELKNIRIAADAEPDTEVKFLRNAPGITVVRPEQ